MLLLAELLKMSLFLRLMYMYLGSLLSLTSCISKCSCANVLLCHLYSSVLSVPSIVCSYDLHHKIRALPQVEWRVVTSLRYRKIH
jgi:hypothetical protein